MRFVLNRLADRRFEDADPELVEAILIEAGRFSGEVLAPLNSTGNRQGCRWFDGKVATPD
jgi:acyl-CoA dehydrogenase